MIFFDKQNFIDNKGRLRFLQEKMKGKSSLIPKTGLIPKVISLRLILDLQAEGKRQLYVSLLRKTQTEEDCVTSPKSVCVGG